MTIARVAARMRELALREFAASTSTPSPRPRRSGAVLVPSEESIRAWKEHPEHLLAQTAGRERWYESYSVQVAAVYANTQSHRAA